MMQLLCTYHYTNRELGFAGEVRNGCRRRWRREVLSGSDQSGIAAGFAPDAELSTGKRNREQQHKGLEQVKDNAVFLVTEAESMAQGRGGTGWEASVEGQGERGSGKGRQGIVRGQVTGGGMEAGMETGADKADTGSFGHSPHIRAQERHRTAFRSMDLCALQFGDTGHRRERFASNTTMGRRPCTFYPSKPRRSGWRRFVQTMGHSYLHWSSERARGA